MTEDTTTPEAELAALEQAAVDGKPVEPDQLATARERVTLAGLFRKGQQMRAVAAAEKQAAEERAEAKRRVTAMFNDDGEPDKLIAEREVAAAQALRDLAAAHEARNEVIREAAAIYKLAGLTEPALGGQVDLLDIPGLDRDFYANITYGNELTFIVERGTPHGFSDAGSSIRRLLTELTQDGIPVGVKL